MADEKAHDLIESGKPVAAEQHGALSTASSKRCGRYKGRHYAETSPAERRRMKMRLAANIMIGSALVGLLVVVFYFLGTWLYASHQQDALRSQLEKENPALAAATHGASERDLVTMGAQAEQSPDSPVRMAAETERETQLEALKTVADSYLMQIIGKVGHPIGRIVIPSIGVDTVMVEGALEGQSDTYLRKGPGHWPETDIPGQGGGVVISGHRSTYGAPFRKIDLLRPGDEIQLIMPYAIIRYTVTQVIVVTPDDVQAVADQGKDQVSLVACHPVYSAKQRIVAQADLTSFVLLKTAQ